MAALDEQAQQDDIRKAEAVLRRVKLPHDIVDFRILAGEDHAGEPALWVNLILPDHVDMQEIVAFVNDLPDAMMAGGVRSWPYVKLVESTH